MMLMLFCWMKLLALRRFNYSGSCFGSQSARRLFTPRDWWRHSDTKWVLLFSDTPIFASGSIRYSDTRQSTQSCTRIVSYSIVATLATAGCAKNHGLLWSAIRHNFWSRKKVKYGNKVPYSQLSRMKIFSAFAHNAWKLKKSLMSYIDSVIWKRAWCFYQQVCQMSNGHDTIAILWV